MMLSIPKETGEYVGDRNPNLSPFTAHGSAVFHHALEILIDLVLRVRIVKKTRHDFCYREQREIDVVVRDRNLLPNAVRMFSDTRKANDSKEDYPSLDGAAAVFSAQIAVSVAEIRRSPIA
jgi:hypothetical protein